MSSSNKSTQSFINERNEIGQMIKQKKTEILVLQKQLDDTNKIIENNCINHHFIRDNTEYNETHFYCIHCYKHSLSQY